MFSELFLVLHRFKGSGTILWPKPKQEDPLFPSQRGYRAFSAKQLFNSKVSSAKLEENKAKNKGKTKKALIN
jgi:hypothetical protein